MREKPKLFMLLKIRILLSSTLRMTQPLLMPRRKAQSKIKAFLIMLYLQDYLSILHEKEIPSHFVEKLSDREMLTKKLDIILVEVVVRNIVAGSLAKRMGIEEGTPLANAVLEFYYKSDPLDDPMINEYHIKAFNLASEEEVDYIKKQALKVKRYS